MCDTQDTQNHSIMQADLRKIAVKLNEDEYEPKHNRGYVSWDHPKKNTSMALTAWEGPLKADDFLPYFCPSGWRRFAVKVPENLDPSFWNKSSNMYHGLQTENVDAIVRGGFRPAKCQHEGKAVYLSPSIRYAAHPRYARIQRLKGLYYQVILQCRVLNAELTSYKDAVLAKNPSVSSSSSEETMAVGEAKVIDVNHPNNLMEFLWFSNTTVTAKDGLVVTGIMVRCLRTNPIDLEENNWWQCWRGRDILMGYVTEHSA